MDRFGQLISSPEVALDLAIWLEKKGEAFYRQANESVDDPTARELFAWLANEESAHCDTYKSLYARLTGEEVEQEELFGEYGHFINLLIEEIVAGIEIGASDTHAEILEKALAFEKSTLRYFQEIRTRFPGEQGRMIDAICEQEKMHIDRLMAAISP